MVNTYGKVLVGVGLVLWMAQPVLAQDLIAPTGGNASEDGQAAQVAQADLAKIQMELEKALAITDSLQRQKAIDAWKAHLLAWQEANGYLVKELEATEEGKAATSEVSKLLEAVKKAISMLDPAAQLKEFQRIKDLLTTWLAEHPAKDGDMLRLVHRQIVYSLLIGVVEVKIAELSRAPVSTAPPSLTPTSSPSPVPAR